MGFFKIIKLSLSDHYHGGAQTRLLDLHILLMAGCPAYPAQIGNDIDMMTLNQDLILQGHKDDNGLVGWLVPIDVLGWSATGGLHHRLGLAL